MGVIKLVIYKYLLLFPILIPISQLLWLNTKKEHRWDDFFDMLEDVDTSDFLKDRKDLPLDCEDIF
jgi:hypothetical protein